MRSLRGLAAASFFLRQASVSRYTPIHRRFLDRPSAAGTVSQIRFVFRGALATTNTDDAKKNSTPALRYSRPTNNEIEDDVIQLVNAEGQLELPTRKSNVLLSMRLNEEILVQLAAGVDGRATVCKIMPLSEFREAERSKEKASRLAKHTAKVSTKQVELNWSINPHDLSHRLKKISSFIDKGRTVELVLTRKRGKRMATTEEIRQLMDSIRTAIDELDARQTKPMDGEVGKTLTITIEKKT